MEEKNWFSQRYAPRILVSSTFEAQELCSRNGFSPSQLINQAAYVQHPISINSIANIISFEVFRVKCIDSFEPQPPLLSEIFDQTAPSVDWNERSKEDLITGQQTPWFSAWSDKFVDNLEYQGHELINMPVAFIYVASVTDTDPTRALQMQCRTQSLPKIYQSNVYYSYIPASFLILHDESTRTLEQAQAMLSEVQNAFPGCLCQILSVKPGQELPLEPNIQQILQQFIVELLTKNIVPYIEQKMRELNTQIESVKKGFRNSLKNLFGGNKAKVEFNFVVGSLEHSMRWLADLAFLSGDYALAYATYNAAASDFRNMKQYRHSSASFDMQAITAFLGQESFRACENAFENSFWCHQRTDDKEYSLRSLFLLFHVYRGHNAQLKLANRLITFSSVDQIDQTLVPMILEQASYAFLKAGLIRKFQFWMVRAGEEYSRREKFRYSLRWQHIALSLYDGWQMAKSVLYRNLARIWFAIDLPLESQYFLTEYLSATRFLESESKVQKKVMTELIASLTKWCQELVPQDYNSITKTNYSFNVEGRPIIQFPIPQISNECFLLPWDTPTSQIAYFETPPTVVVPWKDILDIEEFLIYDTKNQLELKRWNTQNIRVAHIDDEICVRVTVRNQLKLMVFLNNLEVMVKFDHMNVANDGIETIRLERLELRPDEESDVSLYFRPTTIGNLSVLGIQWVYSNVIQAVHYFSYSQYKLNETLGQRSSKTYIPDQRNMLQVIPANAKLSLDFVNFPNTYEGEPTSIYTGQEEKFQLRLRWESTVSDVKIFHSHHQILTVDATEFDDVQGEQIIECVIHSLDQLYGITMLRFVVKYTVDDEVKYERIQGNINIKRSLDIHTNVELSQRDINRVILSLRVQNYIEGSLQFVQVSSFTHFGIGLLKRVSNDIIYFELNPQAQKDVLLTEDLLSGEVADVSNFAPIDDKQQDISLILLWSIDTGTRRIFGYHYIKEQHIKKQEDTGNPRVHITINSPSALTHDFDQEAILSVPIEIKMQNLNQEPLIFSIEAVQSYERLVEQEKSLRPLFFWSGVTKQSFQELTTGEIASCNMIACFTNKGVYNLNRFRFKIGDKFYNPSFEQILIISN